MNAALVLEVLLDFPSFCALLEIRQTKAGAGMLRFNPERWHAEQKRFQKQRRGRDIVIKPRQIGFTTLELARDLWFAIVHHGVNVLVVAHDADLKEQIFLNLRVMAECLKAKGLLPRTRYSTKTELVFADTNSTVRVVEAGATAKAAQKKGRSGTIHRLHATEMAFWGEAGETWAALDAAVPDDGEVVIESTANGAGGLFYDMVMEAMAGKGRYAPHFFGWFQHRRYRTIPPVDFDPLPRDKWEIKLRAAGCDDQQIAWWRAKFSSPEFGPDKTLQEYPVDADSCFRVKGRTFFAADVIDDLVAVEPRRRVPLSVNGRSLGTLFVYEEPIVAGALGWGQEAARYVIGGDVSEGTGADASALTVLERKTGRTVATLQSKDIEPGDFGLAMVDVGKLYNRALLAPERNNHGHAALRAILHEARYQNVYTTDDGKHGWLTDSVTRPTMIDELGGAVRTKAVTTPDRETIAECRTLVHNDKGKVEARAKGKKDGSKDDRWMSWCIAYAVRGRPEAGFVRTKVPGM